MADVIDIEERLPQKDNLLSVHPLEFRRGPWRSGFAMMCTREESARFEEHRRETLRLKGHEHIAFVPNHFSLDGGYHYTVMGLFRYRAEEALMRRVYRLAGWMECVTRATSPVLRTDLLRRLYKTIQEERQALNIVWRGNIQHFLLPSKRKRTSCSTSCRTTTCSTFPKASCPESRDGPAGRSAAYCSRGAPERRDIPLDAGRHGAFMEKKTVIGIDVGGTHMRSALVDSRCTILQRRRTTTEISLGTAFSPNLPAMRNFPLARELETGLGLPVTIENDANVFGLGESRAGAGRGVRNWIGITLGTGVGGCLILDGRLWQGDGLGFVGEIGHMIVWPGGCRCACGASGCLEAYASGRALVEGIRDAEARGELPEADLHRLHARGELTPEDVYRHARAGDALACSVFRRMGRALGLALANLCTVLGLRNAPICARCLAYETR